MFIFAISRILWVFFVSFLQSQSSASHYKQLMNVLEAKVLSLQSELTSISESLHSKEQEFENYKVRIRNLHLYMYVHFYLSHFFVCR